MPTTFTLSYADLPFGGPIDPTIQMEAIALLTPIYPADVGTDIDTVISGSASAAFGSTIHLTDVLVTDANGNPIPGVTISSTSGFDYPLDSANLVAPEPAGLPLVAMGILAAAGLWKRFRRA
ncbi:MAG TPA: hypothetical protein VG297_15775 [Bryobacteraceae bacterium]|nr:hypothetical protein [Bryobacteraceae bacterium]